MGLLDGLDECLQTFALQRCRELRCNPFEISMSSVFSTADVCSYLFLSSYLSVNVLVPRYLWEEPDTLRLGVHHTIPGSPDIFHFSLQHLHEGK